VRAEQWGDWPGENLFRESKSRHNKTKGKELPRKRFRRKFKSGLSEKAFQRFKRGGSDQVKKSLPYSLRLERAGGICSPNSKQKRREMIQKRKKRREH